MVLTRKDAALFFELFMPLLDYTNKIYHVDRSMGTIHLGKELDLGKLVRVADYLWENPGIIDEYIAGSDGLTDEAVEILEGWKNRVGGDFVIERYLKAGSVLIKVNRTDSGIAIEDMVCIVKGVNTSFEEMLQGERLPTVVKVTLLPFKESVITDGLLRRYGISFGTKGREALKNAYMEAKRNGRVITALPSIADHKPEVSGGSGRESANTGDDGANAGSMEDRMYSLAFRLRKAAPWSRLHPLQVFAIRLPETGKKKEAESEEIGYVSVTGMPEQEYGVSLHIGREGFHSLRRIVTTDEADFALDVEWNEFAMQTDCVRVAFEGKNEAPPDDLEKARGMARKYGIKIAGKKPYPVFSRYRPNCCPWIIEDRRECEGICAAMEATLAVLGVVNLPIFDEHTKELPLITVGKNGTLQMETVPVPKETETLYPEPSRFNDIALARIKRGRKRGTLQCMLIRLREPVQEREEDIPAFPMVVLTVDDAEGLILPMPISLEYEDDPNELMQEFMQMLVENETFPAGILVRDERTFHFLEGFCKRTGIGLGRREHLDFLEEAAENLGEHFEAEHGDAWVEEMVSAVLSIPDSELRYMPKEVKAQLKQIIDAGVASEEVAEQLKRKLDRM